MRFNQSYLFYLTTALLLCFNLVLASPVDSSLNTANVLTARGGCAGGINVCCGSTSVGCSGNVCKACCGSTCGCFYVKGSSCSSTLPCTDVTKPDFAMTNGQCVAPKSSTPAPAPVTGGTGSTGSTTSICAALASYPKSIRKIFGCK